MGEFAPIVGLDRLWSIAEEDDCTFCEIYGRVAALLLVGIDKTLSGRLVNHGILVKLISVCAGVTGSWDILYIHLPFDPQFLRRVIVTGVLGFFLG